MEDRDLILIAAAGIAAYYLWIKFREVGYGPSLTRGELTARIQDAGGTVNTTSTGAYYQIPGGVIKLPTEAKLRRWEKGLIWADQFVPGDFLTRWALR